MRGRSGFNLIELAAVAAVALAALAAFFAGYNAWVERAAADSLAVRGRDLFASAAAADAERVPLGRPSVWASELDPVARGQLRTGPGPAAFSNSTELFRCLIENRLCEGLDYDSLAGAGVPTGRSGAFSATNNIWSVAVNLREGLPDTLPVLLTRNVDLSPLVACRSPAGLDPALQADPEWREPLGARAWVCVRKSGAVFKGRFKRETYRTLCGSGPFAACAATNGPAVTRPLTYLTPSRAVVPGGMSP